MKRALSALLVVIVLSMVFAVGSIHGATIAICFEEAFGIEAVEAMEIETLYPASVRLGGEIQWLVTNWASAYNELDSAEKIANIRAIPYLSWKLNVPEGYNALIIVGIGPGNPLHDGAVFKLDLIGLKSIGDVQLGWTRVFDSTGKAMENEGPGIFSLREVEEGSIPGKPCAVSPRGKLATTWGAMKHK